MGRLKGDHFLSEPVRLHSKPHYPKYFDNSSRAISGTIDDRKTKFVLHPERKDSNRVNFELIGSDGQPVRAFVDDASLRQVIENAIKTGTEHEFRYTGDPASLVERTNSPTSDRPLDQIDRNLIAELQEDARLSFAELGRRVGLTTQAVIDRTEKLEDAGVITGYRAEVDASKVGFPITAFVRMSITGVDYSHIIDVAQSSSEVLECHRGTGGDSFIMKLAVSSVEHLQEVIDRLTPYGITTTTIVLSSPVKRKAIEL